MKHRTATVVLGSYMVSTTSTDWQKRAIIAALTKDFGDHTKFNKLIRYDASVVLVSRSLASWLADPSFMRQLVLVLTADGQTIDTAFSMLSAAVDEVPRLTERSSPHGLSVLRGNASDILPGLWEAGIRDSRQKDQSPSFLDFRLPGLQEKSQPLQVTVPLANTIFTTGRPHAFSASRWHAATGAARSELSLAHSVEKTAQTIVLPPLATPKNSRCPPQSFVDTALVPLTKPHKIITGLGNVLRQVEVGAALQPASKELESIIPALLKKRLECSDPAAGHDPPSGPVGIWALIIPKELVSDDYPPRNALDVENYDPRSETDLARSMLVTMDKLLTQGCQIRKVLSGGGGWGLKQGLLSLDSQTKFAAEEHEDLESFIRSFKGEEGAGGIVTPGSYVQFFTESIRPRSIESGGSLYALGTPRISGASEIGMGSCMHPKLDRVFGAFSSEGVYLSSEGSAVMTKLDAPRSYVVCGIKDKKSFRKMGECAT